MSDGGRQIGLFGGSVASRVRGVTPDPAHRRLARRLPTHLRFGTSSWSFPGWHGHVYDGIHDPTDLSREGLPAYAEHPLLRCVGIDRTYYGPASDRELAGYASQVPDPFRFVMKAHDACVLPRFPRHPRHGARQGRENPHFLDPEYATEHVIDPYLAGLGTRAGVVLFQFSPLSPRQLGGRDFVPRLGEFLRALPPAGTYAVELRTAALLTDAYAETLADAGAVHCINALPGMPDVERQAERTRWPHAPVTVLRWMLRPGLRYQEARDLYEPFDRIQQPDPDTRGAVARVVASAVDHGPVYVIVNNKAEGCSPASVVRLAGAVADLLGSGDP